MLHRISRWSIIKYLSPFLFYRTEALLEKAWWKPSLALTDAQVIKVIDGIKHIRLQQQYLVYIKNGVDDATRRSIMWDYENNPKMFSREALRIIEKSLDQPRWNDFSIVMDRLNSPELVWFYIDNYIEYKFGYINTPYEVFKWKTAHCVSSSYFGKLALDRAGYKTFMRHVAWGPWGTCNNGICYDHAGAGIILDDGRYFLVVDFQHSKSKPLSGPYDDIYEVDAVLAYGHKITERMWGAKWPAGQ